ncbi:phage tail protein [Serratia marcescens]
MADYYAILTNTGKALEANATANGTVITLTHFVVGDGNGQVQTPDPTRTTLVHEVYRNSISNLSVSQEQDNQIVGQLVIPASVGGFTVREIGLLTDHGELYAIANCAAFEKPVNGVSITFQFRLAVSDTENIMLNIATGDGLFLRIDKNLSDVKNKSSARSNIDVYSKSEGDERYLKQDENLNDLSNKSQARNNLDIYSKAESDERHVNSIGDTMTGQLIAPSVATTPEATPWGAGSYAAQLSTQAPFFQPNWQWPVTSGGVYVPIVKGVSTRQGQGYIAAVSFGYLLSGTPSFPQACIHVKGDNTDFNWRFDANSGNFYCPGGVYAAGAILHVDGNITGNIWGGYLSDWLNNSFLARDNNIGTRATWDYVNQNFIQNVRYSAETQVGATGVNTYHSNTVLTGFDNWDYDYSAESLFWSHIQILKNGQWLTIGR